MSTLTTSDYLAKALEGYFADAHIACTHDDQPIDVKGCNAFVAQHLGAVEELVANYVEEHF